MNDSLSQALQRQLQKLMPEKFPAPAKKVKMPDVQTTGFRKTHLVFQEGSSNKEYIVQIAAVKGLYEVRFEYGRVGGTHQKGIKNDSPVGLVQANEIFNKLVADKKKKGYKEK